MHSRKNCCRGEAIRITCFCVCLYIYIIQGMKNGKAPGIGTITVELIKNAGK